jgi:hypothetical protein
MSRKILFNGKHYELVHWHFRYLEAKDEFGNKLLIKHSQNQNSMKRLIEEAKELIKETIWTWFADEPMQMVHIRITVYIIFGVLIIAGALVEWFCK